MFNRILVATDFSAPSAAALEYARTIAARFGSSLHLLHVVEDPYRSAYAAEVYVPNLDGLRDDLISTAISRLQDCLRSPDTGELWATTDAVVGTPAWSIVEYAASHGIDLIVMGTHGRGGMSHLLMGSVAEKVVQTSLCPVLTTRQPLEPVKAQAAEGGAIERSPDRIAMANLAGGLVG